MRERRSASRFLVQFFLIRFLRFARVMRHGKTYVCEYCGVTLNNTSVKSRREHDAGKNHKQAVREYWAQFVPANVPAPQWVPICLQMPMPALLPMQSIRKCSPNMSCREFW
eukprot:c18281_g1_i8.p1 GENE.c18281_g1_i8~~c18281_g1_i8.p1  ORF type:complete len:121 (-),score=15.01 c18281_g1_i8:40-372(-)